MKKLDGSLETSHYASWLDRHEPESWPAHIIPSHEYILGYCRAKHNGRIESLCYQSALYRYRGDGVPANKERIRNDYRLKLQRGLDLQNLH